LSASSSSKVSGSGCSSDGSDDLGVFGEAAFAVSREDELAAGGDVEGAGRPGDEPRLDAGRLPDGGRQTDGPRLVASVLAVGNDDVHA